MTTPIDPKLSERLLNQAAELVRFDNTRTSNLASDLRQAADAIDALQAQLNEWKEHAALSDKELCDMSDWIIGNAEFDPKTGLIDHAKKLRERIRDLIAAEGELGDAKQQLAAKDAEIEAEKKAHAKTAKQYVDSRAIEGCLEIKLESAQKACAEMRDAMVNILGEGYNPPDSWTHAISSDCGKDYHHKDTCAKERELLRRCVEGAEQLVSKIELIHENSLYQEVWFCAYNHGIDYSSGPKYDEELQQLKQLLTEAQALGITTS